MSGSKLPMKIGDQLQVEFVGQPNRSRHYVTVVGYLPGKSVVVTPPLSNGKPILVKDGQNFFVRTILGTQAMGFPARVIKSVSTPYPYLHLTYPRDVETSTVRGALRVNTKFVASIENISATDVPVRPARILDMSVMGMLIASEEPVGIVGDVLKAKIKMSVASVTRYVTFECLIRNEFTDGGEDDGTLPYNVGVTFQNLDEEQVLLLNAFVYRSALEQGVS